MPAVKNYLFFLLVLLLVLSLAGCRKIYMVEAYPTSNGWAFSIPDITAKYNNGTPFLVIDFVINKHPCQQNCAVWEFAITEQPNTLNTDNPLAFTNKLIYGQLPAGMQVSVPAKPLEIGTYSIAGTIAEYDRRGKPAATLLLHGEFQVR